jgi:hypothetical protein
MVRCRSPIVKRMVAQHMIARSRNGAARTGIDRFITIGFALTRDPVSAGQSREELQSLIDRRRRRSRPRSIDAVLRPDKGR